MNNEENENENENENEHFSYNPKFQNQNMDLNRGGHSIDYDNERNPNEYSNLHNSNNQHYSNNNSAIKNRNDYSEEKKDYSNFGGGNSQSFYKNDNKKGTFGAYEKRKVQNEINEEINYNNNNDNYKGSKKDLRYLQETQSSRNLKRVYSGVDRSTITPRKSLEEIEEEQKKKKNAAEKCFSLYENGKIKNEVNRLLAEKNQKIKEEMELKECTFFPKTNFNERFVGDKNVNNQMMKKLESNFYDRIISWQQKKEKK